MSGCRNGKTCQESAVVILMEDNKGAANVIKMNSVALLDAESMGTGGCLVS